MKTIYEFETNAGIEEHARHLSPLMDGEAALHPFVRTTVQLTNRNDLLRIEQWCYFRKGEEIQEQTPVVGKTSSAVKRLGFLHLLTNP